MLPGRTHYAPTKLGLEALTRNISAEMSPLGIRVNCVHPGLIDTDMTAWVMKRPDHCRDFWRRFPLNALERRARSERSWRFSRQTMPVISQVSRSMLMAAGLASEMKRWRMRNAEKVY